MNEAEKMLLLLGERGKEYLREYIKLKQIKKLDMEAFVAEFNQFIEQQPIGNDGLKTISKFNFRNYLLSLDVVNCL